MAYLSKPICRNVFSHVEPVQREEKTNTLSKEPFLYEHSFPFLVQLGSVY